MVLKAIRAYYDMAQHKAFVNGDVYEEPNEKNANSLIKHGFAISAGALQPTEEKPVKRARKSKKDNIE